MHLWSLAKLQTFFEWIKALHWKWMSYVILCSKSKFCTMHMNRRLKPRKHKIIINIIVQPHEIWSFCNLKKYLNLIVISIAISNLPSRGSLGSTARLTIHRQEEENYVCVFDAPVIQVFYWLVTSANAVPIQANQMLNNNFVVLKNKELNRNKKDHYYVWRLSITIFVICMWNNSRVRVRIVKSNINTI